MSASMAAFSGCFSIQVGHGGRAGASRGARETLAVPRLYALAGHVRDASVGFCSGAPQGWVGLYHILPQ